MIKSIMRKVRVMKFFSNKSLLYLKNIRFRYERFLALRGFSIYLTLIFFFMLTYCVLLFIHWVVIYTFDIPWAQKVSLPWHIVLELLSPARVTALHHDSILLKILSIFTTLIGIGFFSTLIAYTTASTTRIIKQFRRGIGSIPEIKHSLILGYDDRVYEIIKELNFSNHQIRALPIVVLSDHDKEAMDEDLQYWFNRKKKIRLSTSRGEPSSLHNLTRVNARQARSSIILARCTQAASQQEKEASDARVLQTIKSIYATQSHNNRYPIVAEIFDPSRRELIMSLAPNIVSLDSNRFLASMLVQSALFPGLERVYSELLSFEMSEFYYYQVPAGERFADLAFHFKDGIPIGIRNEKDQLILLPDQNYRMQATDKLLLIALDDKYIRFDTKALFHPIMPKRKATHYPLASQQVLILGWHYIAPSIFQECINRLPHHSSITVVTQEKSESLLTCLKQDVQHLDIQHIPVDSFSFQHLKSLKPYSYDTVILLCHSSHTATEEQMDADTLMLILLLRRIKEELPQTHSIYTRIVTQLFRPENEKLIQKDDPVDFVITSQVATMLLTQLSEEVHMLETYHLIFNEHQVSTYLKPIERYLDHLPKEVEFIELFCAAQAQDEICIGFQSSMPSLQVAPFQGIRINPPKNEKFLFEKGDRMIVICRNANHHLYIP